MSKEQTQQERQKIADELFSVDLKRAVVMTSIARIFLEDVMSRKRLPKQLHPDITGPIRDGMKKLEDVVRSMNPYKDQKMYLDRTLKQDKLLDIATIVDNMLRINVEENQEVYDEFLGMVTDVINEIFYAQKNRRKAHFGKYRALFKFFTDELHADINRLPPRIMFINKQELFFRPAAVIDNSEIKDNFQILSTYS